MLLDNSAITDFSSVNRSIGRSGSGLEFGLEEGRSPEGSSVSSKGGQSDRFTEKSAQGSVMGERETLCVGFMPGIWVEVICETHSEQEGNSEASPLLAGVG